MCLYYWCSCFSSRWPTTKKNLNKMSKISIIWHTIYCTMIVIFLGIQESFINTVGSKERDQNTSSACKSILQSQSIACMSSTTSPNTHNITTQTCTLLLCLILQQTSSCMVEGCLNGGERRMHGCKESVSYIRNCIITISFLLQQLSVRTVIVICHCCIYIPICKEFRRSKEAEGEVWQTNCPFISCKEMKKLGHLVCQDQAAALGVSIYNTACNKCDNICVLDIKL